MTLLTKTSPLLSNTPSLMSGFFDDDRFWNFDFGNGLIAKMPSANIIENDEDYVVELATPGMTKKDFTIEADKGTLTVSSEKKEEKEEKEDNYTRKEFSYNSFSRSFALPDITDAEHIKAKYEEGVLRIVIPKKPEAKRLAKRTIAVK